MPEFEWDEAKRQANIAKHGIDFLRIQQLFDGRPLWSIEVQRQGETRGVSVGLLGNHIYTVVTTQRGSRIRIISARRANERERAEYREVYG